jgi:hypothetical protein
MAVSNAVSSKGKLMTQGTAHQTILRVVRVSSSLQLQKLLFYNFYFSIAYGACHLSSMAYKLMQFEGLSENFAILPGGIGAWIILECARLRLAYLGNLNEQVPTLSAFWLLTILPQLPLVAWMSFYQWETALVLKLDNIVGAIMILILLLELYYGIGTVRTLIRNQTADFYHLVLQEARLQAVNEGTSVNSIKIPEPPTDPAVSPISVATDGAQYLQRVVTGKPEKPEGKSD